MYALRPHETIHDGIQLAATKSTHECVRLLEEDSGGLLDDKAVHTIRTRVKALRALIKLVRADLGERRYRRAKACLQETGHALSPIRDARVVLITCKRVVRRWDGVDCNPLYAALQERHAKARAMMARSKRQLLTRRLMAVEALLTAWRESRAGRKSLGRGLRHIYAAGRAAFESRSRASSEADLHELRKRAKDLLYACAFLRKTSRVAKSLLEDLRRFTALLGLDHDLALLRRAASRVSLEHGGPQRAYLRNLALDQQGTLRQRALRIGLRIYAHPPSNFVNRILRDCKKTS